MKKMLLLLTLAVGIATAQAQTTPAANGNAYGRRGHAAGREQRTPEQRAELQTRQLTKKLNLSAEQQAKVQPIFLAQAQDTDKLRGQATPGSADRGAMREQLQASRTRTDEQLKAVLTPAQFTQYQQMREERRENMQEARQAKTRGRRGGLQPAG